MKEQILSVIKMNDILDKYNIKRNKNQFCCPFHGKDIHPSAKSYEDSFYCFNCGKTGDLIQFVQYLFNLNFKEAMQKINEDFNLNIDSKTKIDYKKIKEIENKRKEKHLIYENLANKFKTLCSLKFKYIHNIEEMNKKIKINNWENITEKISKIQEKIGNIDMELDELIEKMYINKNS